ncbi:hypothetical protein DL98DRAFT_662675, partial [Cadophora sp. DSE1049]
VIDSEGNLSIPSEKVINTPTLTSKSPYKSKLTPFTNKSRFTRRRARNSQRKLIRQTFFQKLSQKPSNITQNKQQPFTSFFTPKPRL